MPWLEARPEPLVPALQWFLDVFWELSRDRQITMAGPGTIPGRVIRDYAREEGVHEPELFKRLMWKLDTVFLNWQRERSKSDD